MPRWCFDGVGAGLVVWVCQELAGTRTFEDSMDIFRGRMGLEARVVVHHKDRRNVSVVDCAKPWVVD